MKSRVGGSGVVIGLMFLLAHTPVASAESMEAGKAFGKLTRGGINLVTGWVEIPKRIQETSETSGAFAGFTWGLLRGLGYGFVRTAAGGYEIITFPFPAPANYEPVRYEPASYEHDRNNQQIAK